MSVNIITIDGEDYDPYFILGVASDDTDDHINKNFRKKIKKYHPDKIDNKKDKKRYEYYSKIILECYGYIKEKRKSSQKLKKRDSSSKQNLKILTKEELDDFNKNFENKCDVKVEEKQKRLKKIDDYKKQDVTQHDITKQFSKKKFSNKDFNAVFDYNKNLDKNDVSSNSLIYRTSDGFFGYNASDVGNCAMVSSYNGLLISGDTIGEMGKGCWSNNYSDYNQSFGNAIKNPKGKLNMEHIYKENKKNIIEPKVKTTFNEYQKSYNTFKYTVQDTYNKEQDKLFKRTFDHLLEKEKWDQQVVMKYKDQYEPDVIEQALNGELEVTPTLMENLKGHYRQIREK